ncbi:UV-B-induced protein At3g17800, chloroplastic-like [Nymphaea colorata]|nr:UV-B-induced protein At3g17800, chloroplastic-like [Nymphaea colorata]
MDCCLHASLAKNPVFARHSSAVAFVDRAFCRRSLAGSRSPKLGSVSFSGFSSCFLGLLLRDGAGQCGSRVRYGNSTCVILPLASAGVNERETDAVTTPLELTSPAGKFLTGILRNQRHLFAAAVAEQLEQLAEDRHGAISRKRSSADTVEWLLHSRIAELKEEECKVAVEEVMYMLVVHKFLEIDVPMVPRLTRCTCNGKLGTWPLKDHELESVHGSEILEMVEEHLCRVLGQRGNAVASDNWTATRIRRLHLGRVYAASILYGYFLKSAWQKHCLEKNFINTDRDFPVTCTIRLPPPGFWPGASDEEVIATAATAKLQPYSTCASRAQMQMKNVYRSTFKKYILSFDMESFQTCATLKSKEAVNLVEKHCWALFGRSGNAGLGELQDDEILTVTFSSLRRLLLEAIAFGSFLWDVESYVDSVYRLNE